MNLIDKHKHDINKLCLNYRVKELYAFGSTLTDSFNKNSDIDLLVNFEPIDVSIYADNYFDFKFSLQNLLNRPIDLLEEKALKNPFLKKNIQQQRQLIYGH